MQRMRYLLAVMPLVLLPTLFLSGCDEVFGPRNFEDCLLKNARGVNSDGAAKLIYRACREKFPKPSGSIGFEP